MPFLSSYDQKLIPDERPGENWYLVSDQAILANFDIPVNMFTSAKGSCTDSPFDTDKADGNGVHLVWNTYLLTQVISLLLEVTTQMLSDLEGSDVPVVAEKEDDKLGLISDWNQLNLEQCQTVPTNPKNDKKSKKMTKRTKNSK